MLEAREQCSVDYTHSFIAHPTAIKCLVRPNVQYKQAALCCKASAAMLDVSLEAMTTVLAKRYSV
jgi:hypothetical protein